MSHFSYFRHFERSERSERSREISVIKAVLVYRDFSIPPANAGSSRNDGGMN